MRRCEGTDQVDRQVRDGRARRGRHDLPPVPRATRRVAA